MKKLIIISLLAIGVVSCASTPPTPVERVIYKTTPFQLPSAPTLPTWKASDMSCLSVEMKQKILNRDKARKGYIEELQTIIKSTQK